MHSKPHTSLFVAILLLLWTASGFAQAGSAVSGNGDKERVAATAHVLAGTYEKETGIFHGTGWWNAANGISALANASRALNTTDFDSIFTNTFTQAQKTHPEFLNEFYDDEGWWALAWLDVYELRGGTRYLDASKSIFDDMKTGWSDTCQGGIWWKKDKHYKNAIANELFLSVAVRLAAVSSGEARAGYLDWAQKEERWFVNSGMVNEQGLVNDGLDAACHNNQKTTWTYNQGVILTGLSGLTTLNHASEPLQLANRIAAAVNKHLADSNRVVHDPCEPKCGEDGIQFKGILMRNLVALEKASPSQQIALLLRKNAGSVWKNARTESGVFSVDWAGPPQDSGTGSLISALDALTAPVLLQESR